MNDRDAAEAILERKATLCGHAHSVCYIQVCIDKQGRDIRSLMNVVGPAWQCPRLALGPGDSTLDHTPDEHIVVDEFRRIVGVLAIAPDLLVS